MSELVKLYTEKGKNLGSTPLADYPRPQLRRESYICLNGEWDFEVCPLNESPNSYSKKIIVPFAPQSLLSGLNELCSEKAAHWYRRSFILPEGFKKDRVILNIGACDQIAQVYVNNKYIGKHEGGYLPFSFDITDALDEENTLVIRVEDRLSTNEFPYGKQKHNRGGMWYTPVSGIWQTVWLESVNEQYIKSLKITTDSKSANIVLNGVDKAKIIVDTPNGELVYNTENGRVWVELNCPKMWSPEEPYLYNFTVETENDKVESYFAVRTLEIKEVNGYKRLCLNGKPYFFHGLLDQGYWSDGLFTPAAYEYYEKDILSMKSLGYNTLRKHIKIEPEMFYYACDRLGMIVFQDMVNNGDYNFFRDTVLPTVFTKHAFDSLMHINKKTRKRFIEAMDNTVECLYNHPCICYWTIFNEGWGQFCSTKMYNRLKEKDCTRFIDSASGWFFGGKTDVDSYHIYFKKIKLKAKQRPLCLTEFGGYSFRPEGHIFNPNKTYGYGSYFDRADFVKAFQNLYNNEIFPLVKEGLCCAIYTQVSDVEDETNGIFTYDRAVLKVEPQEFYNISKNICKEITE